MLDRVSTNKFNRLATNVMRSTLATKFPNDFETYLMALELVDSSGNTVDSISFPVMPNHIQKNEVNRVNVKKSSNGIVVLSSNSKAPSEIIVRGDFGRGFKLMLQPQREAVEGYAFRGLSFNTPEYEVGVKTGYGAFKLLQSIISRCTELDNSGNPHRLILYNMALGEIYLVVPSPNGVMFTQTQDRNMIWQYNITFIILGNLYDLSSSKKRDSSVELMKASILQNGVNIVGSEIRSIL